MSDDIDLGLDDLNDDSMNLDLDLDLNVGPEKDNRKPTNVIKDAVINRAIVSGTDEHMLRTKADKLLPSGYTAVVKDAFDIKNELIRIKRQVLKDLPEDTRLLKTIAHRAAPLVERTLGKTKGGSKTADWLKKVGKEPKGQFAPDYNAEDLAVAERIASVFGGAIQSQMEATEETNKSNLTQKVVQEQKLDTQFKSKFALQTQANNFLSQLVGYQTLDARYKRVNLELQQRQYFIQRKHLEMATESNNILLRDLKAIVKNTALPEITKIRLSESVHERVQDKLASSVHDRASGYISRSIRTAGDKLIDKKDALREQLKEASDVFETVMASIDSMEEDTRTEEEKQEAARNQAITIISEMGYDAATNKILAKFITKLSKNAKFRQLNQKAQYLSENKGRMIDDFVEENRYQDGLKGLAARGLGTVFKGMGTSTYQVDTQNADSRNLDDPVTWTSRSDKTLNEIIPGWLAKIEQGVRSIHKGSDQEEHTYDFEANRFNTRTKAKSNLTRHLFSQEEYDYRSGSAETFVKIADPMKELSPSARKALQSIVMKNSGNRVGFKFQDLQDNSLGYYNGVDDKDAAELMEFFGGKDVNTDTGIRSQVHLARNWNKTGRQAPKIQDTLDKANNYKQVDLLREMGLVKGEIYNDFDYNEFYDKYSGLDETRGRKDENLRRKPQNTNGPNHPAYDVFVKGEHEPRLVKVLFERDAYFDSKSGEIITYPEAISGAVTDSGGNVVLSLKDLDTGITDNAGQEVACRYRGRNIRSIFKGAAKRIIPEDTTSTAEDVFVADDTNPIMTKENMLRGKYFDGESGKPIESVDDIKDSVVDESGNVIVTPSDVKRGLFTRTGRRITAFYKKATRKFNHGKFSGDKTESGNIADDIAKRTLKVELVQPKKVKGDSDGDGTRDNSWQDILSRKDKKADKDVSPEDLAKKDKKKSNFSLMGLLGGLAGVVGSIISGLGGLGSAIGGLVSTVGSMSGLLISAVKGISTLFTAKKGLDIAGDALEMAKDGKTIMKDAPKAGKKGFLRKGFDIAKKGAGALWKGTKAAGSLALRGSKSILRVGGRILGSQAVRTGATWAARAALGFVSSPLALGALAVISIGALGWGLFSWWNRRRLPGIVETLRFMQYGVDCKNKSLLSATREFEEDMSDYVKITGNSLEIPDTAEDLFMEFAGDFDLDSDNDQNKLDWCYWYNFRFKPVYLTWIAACSGFTDEDGDALKISNVDDIKKEDTYQLGKATLFTDEADPDPYEVPASPFNNISLTYGRKQIEDYVENEMSKFGTDIRDLKESKKEADARKQKSLDAAAGKPSSQSKSSTYSPTGDRSLSTGGSISHQTKANLEKKGKRASELTAIERVRYYQYGINIKSDEHVTAIYQLELFINAHASIAKDTVKMTVGADDIIANCGAAFRVVDKTRADFNGWFKYRFMPVFSRLLLILDKDGYKLENYQDHLKGADQVNFIYESIANRLDGVDGLVPFEVAYSPFASYMVPTDMTDLSAFVDSEANNLEKQLDLSSDTSDKAQAQRVKEYNARVNKQSKDTVESQKGHNQTDDKGNPLVGMFGGLTSFIEKANSLLGITSTGKADGIGAVDLMKDAGDGVPLPHKLTDDVEKRIAQYDDIIASAAKKYGVDQNLIRSVIRQESGGDPNAKSGVGAVGLMQFMPATAKDMGITDRTDPTQSIFGGAKYLKQLLDRYNGNVELALASYNAGMGNIDKAVKKAGTTEGAEVLGVLPSITGDHAKETQDYVRKITGDYRRRRKNMGMPATDNVYHSTNADGSPDTTTTGGGGSKISITKAPTNAGMITSGSSDTSTTKDTSKTPTLDSTQPGATTPVKSDMEIQTDRQVQATNVVSSNQQQLNGISNDAKSIARESLDVLKNLRDIVSVISDKMDVSVNSTSTTASTPPPATGGSEASEYSSGEVSVPVPMNKKSYA